MRSVYETGVCEVAPCVREGLESLANGTVIVYEDGKKLGAAFMAKHKEWAIGHIERLVEEKPSDLRLYRAYHNISSSVVRGTAFAEDGFNVAVAMPVSEGRAISLAKPTTARMHTKGASKGGPPRPRVNNKIPFRVPERMSELAEAPILDMCTTERRNRLSMGEDLPILRKTSHVWWDGPRGRLTVDRGEELEWMMAECDPISESRGWGSIKATREINRALDALEGVSVEGEAIVQTEGGNYDLVNDRLWRLSSTGQYFSWNRRSFLMPEGNCCLLEVPLNHECFDNLAREKVPVDKVNWGLTQGVHGFHSRLMGDIAWEVNDSVGERVQAEFRGCGLNTVAMVWDVQYGKSEWDIVACHEANPYVAWMLKKAWGERVTKVHERAELPADLPLGTRVNTSMNSLQCQPWSWKNIRGIESLNDALDERYATYKAIRLNKPNVIFDEMLSRSHMNGKRAAWERAEMLREKALPEYDWRILNSDAGNLQESMMRSHREIAVGVLPQFTELVDEVVLAHGFTKGGRRLDEY